MRTHMTNIELHACPGCKKEFRFKSSMYKHRRKSHLCQMTIVEVPPEYAATVRSLNNNSTEASDNGAITKELV